MHFEKVKRFADSDINLPIRATKLAAGYDFEVAEDTLIPSYIEILASIQQTKEFKDMTYPFTLDEMASFTKKYGLKPTLVPTGVKAILDPDTYLQLAVRSSFPLKHWVILGNGPAIVDADYANNESNDGEIFFQLINLSPMPIILHKGDKIGQGVIMKYLKVDGDESATVREGGLGSTSK